MNEFSPSIVGDLGALLTLVSKHSGKADGLTEAVAAHCQKIAATPNVQRQKRARNVLIGMSQCGLFDLQTNELTELGEQLLAEPDTDERARAFAKHLIGKRHGDSVVQAALALQQRDGRVTLKAMQEQLRLQGLSLTVNCGDPSKVRLWLEQAGVMTPTWEVSDAAYASLTGVTPKARDSWRGLTRPQRAFATTLRGLRTNDWVPSTHVKRLTQAHWGRILSEANLRT